MSWQPAGFFCWADFDHLIHVGKCIVCQNDRPLDCVNNNWIQCFTQTRLKNYNQSSLMDIIFCLLAVFWPQLVSALITVMQFSWVGIFPDRLTTWNESTVAYSFTPLNHLIYCNDVSVKHKFCELSYLKPTYGKCKSSYLVLDLVYNKHFKFLHLSWIIYFLAYTFSGGVFRKSYMACKLLNIK